MVTDARRASYRPIPHYSPHVTTGIFISSPIILQMSTLYPVIGVILEIASVFGVLFILGIIITIIRLELWKTSNFFITALASLFNDLLLCLIFAAYIGPSILAEVICPHSSK